MIGQQLGSYTIRSELGSGGMGTVYRAEDDEGNVFAIKVVHPHLLATPGFFKRFLREAEAGRRVEHGNVVRTLDADAIAVGGTQHHFLVMEYVERHPQEQLDFFPGGEQSTWWKGRAKQIRAATRRPLRRIRVPRETDLYGRDADLAHLRSLYLRAAAGHGQVVLIEGEKRGSGRRVSRTS